MKKKKESRKMYAVWIAKDGVHEKVQGKKPFEKIYVPVLNRYAMRILSILLELRKLSQEPIKNEVVIRKERELKKELNVLVVK